MGHRRGKFKYILIGTLVLLVIIFCKPLIMNRRGVNRNTDMDNEPDVVQEDDKDVPDDVPEDEIIIPKPTPYAKGENGKYYSEQPNDLLVVINKYIGLIKHYKPENLVTPNVNLTFHNSTMRKEAAQAMEKLFEKAYNDGIDLTLRTGYRSYDHQNTIYHNSIQSHGLEYTNKFVALPGHSEHQTGLAADLASLSEGHTLSPEFSQTRAGIWIEENCAKFGFIIRYPKDKEDITGYSYEPWHIRYVGVEYAEYITNNNITLEEFFGFKNEDSY